MKQATVSNLKQKEKGEEYKSMIMLVERQIETGKMIKKPDGTEEPQKVPRIDVLVLNDELRGDFKKINELAKIIAKMNGRSIITYTDAEDAIKLVKARKTAFKRCL